MTPRKEAIPIMRGNKRQCRLSRLRNGETHPDVQDNRGNQNSSSCISSQQMLLGIGPSSA